MKKIIVFFSFLIFNSSFLFAVWPDHIVISEIATWRL